MPVLDAQGLQKSLGTRTLLDGVNLTIVRGEKIGVVGDNGAGKSTLAKILAGVLDFDGGDIHRRRGTRVAYLEQDPQFEPGQTALDIALTGLEAYNDARARFDAISEKLADPGDELEALLTAQEEVSHEIEQLGGWSRPDDAARILRTLDIHRHDQLIETMSGGERRRVALARLLVSEPDLAVLDEPTNHLDADTIEWLEGYLRDTFKGAILLITHDRWLLNSVVSRTVEVEHGQLYSYAGGWGEFLIGREERRDQADRAESNRQNFLRKEVEWLRRQPKARTGKQKARIGRAEAALGESAPEQTKALELKLAEDRLGGTVLETRHLAVTVAGKTLLTDLDFYLTRGSRVGIVGKSGAGKTSLIRTLLGELPPGAGEVVMGKNTKVAYLDQMRSDVDDTLTVYDAITGGRPSVTVGETEFSSYSYLEKFRFRGDAVRQKVAGLSGGERARVALARLLLSTANVLVLDEPTNDLDVMTLSALEDLLLSLSGAALIVSHDRYFLDRIATSVLALRGDGTATEVQGGYESYQAWRIQADKEKREETRAEGLEQAAAAEDPSGGPQKEKKKLTYKENLEFAGLMKTIEKLTSEVKVLEAELADPTLYVERRDEAQSKQATLEKTRGSLEELELRWLELEERRS